MPRLGRGFNDGTLGLAALAIVLSALVVWTARGPNVERTDFALTYVGAHIVHVGDGRHLYDLGLQIKLRDSLFQHASPLYFEHPTFEALALAPLAAFSFRTAYLVWGLLNVAMLLIIIVRVRTHLHWPSEDIAYLLLWLIFAPALVAIYQGQSSILVLAAYAAAFVELRKGNAFAAGIVFGLALLKFQFAVPFTLIFLLRRQWRFATGFLVSSLALGALSLVAAGWGGVADYIRHLSKIGSNPQNVSYGSAVDMPTLHGLVYAIAGQVLGPVGLNAAVAVLSIALLAWVAMKWGRTQGDASPLFFAAAVAASLLCGSHMFTHDFSPLGLALFAAGASLFAMNRGLRIATAFTLSVFWMVPLYFLFVNWHCLYLMALVLLAFTWCCVQGASQVAQQTASA